MVDRAICLWKCEIWVSVGGSRYPHQYVGWAHKFISSANFLPVFSQFEKQHFTKIAIDESIEIHFYEPLDGLKIEYIGTYRGNSCSNAANCDENMSVAEVKRLNLKINNLQDEAWVELGEIYKKLYDSLSKEDE